MPLLVIDRELGVELAVRYLPSGVQAPENVVAGDAHFAGTGFPIMPGFVAKGKPVVALATLSSGTAPYAVLVRNDLARKIRSLKDLKGRSIGIPLGSSTSKTYLQVLMELWMDSYGVKSHQVRWVPVGMNLDSMHGALASGAVDAVFCEEPLSGTLERKKIGTLLASLSDPKNPAHIVGRQHLRAVIASTPDSVASSPLRAEQMVRMLQRSLHWIRKTPAEAVVAKLKLVDAEQARFVPFYEKKGKLPWPIAGKVITRFGIEPYLNTRTMNNGIEIAPPKDDIVVHAVHPGKVVYADYFQGYGNLLIVDHGMTYYTLYGHCAEFLAAVGDMVRAGQPLAVVGDTGSLKGECLISSSATRPRPSIPCNG